ncbi:hypothetical protein [Vibrio phage vB_VmeM-Yong XC32]|nr:hypothetical protein [Vibrio phage vB_VmeM-Yong XC31]QAX96369.1 hypothetical protein [Vibrio phage vB_VmeM-Yong XC32]QAX96687.1 hypothetical protein [Vibrio phage vB_VmeM-Yong MS31]QAX97005.1 hypothetical protein [Vibrio phage vB_VmeM-Yong MS32]
MKVTGLVIRIPQVQADEVGKRSFDETIILRVAEKYRLTMEHRQLPIGTPIILIEPETKRTAIAYMEAMLEARDAKGRFYIRISEPHIEEEHSQPWKFERGIEGHSGVKTIEFEYFAK